MCRNPFSLATLLLATLLLTHCSGQQETAESPSLQVSKAPFGATPDGPAELFTLTNANGVEVRITNFGATVVSLLTPDKDGKLEDIVLGFESVGGYVGDNPYFGAIVGRYGNRIAKAQFTLDGKTYTLAANNGPNHLHGGVKGFNKVLWSGTEVRQDSAVGVRFTYRSKDGEEGYPGNLNVAVTYLLNDANELSISYEATTDQPTVCNLTNHTYFNLTGGMKTDILGHQLMINADRFTPVDSTLIPTGEPAPVAGTPFDFRRPTAIGDRVNADDEQIKNGGGYDHNFVLNRSGEGLQLAATVYEPSSGRFLEVLTEEPGVQFYCGNFLDGSITGKGGKSYPYRSGLCLETQHFPDSPNQPDFPSTVLRPGETYATKTVYRFGVR